MEIKASEVVSFNGDAVVVARIPAETMNGEHLGITRNGELVVYNFSVKEADIYKKEKHGNIRFFTNAKLFI